MLNHAQELLKIDQHKRALEEFEKILDLESNNADAWYGKAEALRHLGKLYEAVNAYDEALKLDPKNDLWWFIKGNTLSSLDNKTEALEAFEKVLEIKPDDDLARFQKTIQLTKLGLFEQALESSNKLLELKPEDCENLRLKIEILENILLKSNNNLQQAKEQQLIALGDNGNRKNLLYQDSDKVAKDLLELFVRMYPHYNGSTIPHHFVDHYWATIYGLTTSDLLDNKELELFAFKVVAKASNDFYILHPPEKRVELNIDEIKNKKLEIIRHAKAKIQEIGIDEISKNVVKKFLDDYPCYSHSFIPHDFFTLYWSETYLIIKRDIDADRELEVLVEKAEAKANLLYESARKEARMPTLKESESPDLKSREKFLEDFLKIVIADVKHNTDSFRLILFQTVNSTKQAFSHYELSAPVNSTEALDYVTHKLPETFPSAFKSLTLEEREHIFDLMKKPSNVLAEDVIEYFKKPDNLWAIFDRSGQGGRKIISERFWRETYPEFVKTPFDPLQFEIDWDFRKKRDDLIQEVESKSYRIIVEKFREWATKKGLTRVSKNDERIFLIDANLENTPARFQKELLIDVNNQL
jgi:tetratricopeptide (TPR) repeat protein